MQEQCVRGIGCHDTNDIRRGGIFCLKISAYEDLARSYLSVSLSLFLRLSLSLSLKI